MNWCACNQAHDLRLLLINIDVVFLLAKHAYHQIETLGIILIIIIIIVDYYYYYYY